MSRALLSRLGSAVLLLYLVLTATFFLIHLAPGDPAAMFAGEHETGRSTGRLRELWGLDRPLHEQYLAWLGAVVLHADWGHSFTHGRPVVQVIASTLPATALLGMTALLVQFGVGLTLGVAAARRRDRRADGAIRFGSLLLYSTPTFWLGLMAILLFAYAVPILPPSHMRSIGGGDLTGWRAALDVARHLVLPAAVLGLTAAGGTVRYVRNRMVEELDRDYIRTARAKGLSEGRVVWVHALRNALVPVVQLLGLSIPFLLNGALVVEVVFSWPGLGRTTFQALLARDYPLILAVTALTGALVVLGNLLADLLHALVDPRVRRA